MLLMGKSVNQLWPNGHFQVRELYQRVYYTSIEVEAPKDSYVFFAHNLPVTTVDGGSSPCRYSLVIEHSCGKSQVLMGNVKFP